MPENITPSSGKVCLTCGYEDCETVEQNFAQNADATDERPATILPTDQNGQIWQAAEMLAGSKSTLICGLDCLNLNAQMAAWKLADQSRAIIDTSLANHSHAAIESLQRNGKVSATYGEICSRSDLIVIWDCDLQRQHPCLLRMLTSAQVSDREIVFVGPRDAPMAKLADRVFPLHMSNHTNAMVRLICRLRAKIAGNALHDEHYDEQDLPATKVQELFNAMTNASYGSLFFAPNEPDWEFDLETDSLLQLVSELNTIAPMVSMEVRDDANGLGAQNVLTLASGFPAAISLQRGYATSTGSLYTASEVLRRSACDMILLCGNVTQNGSAAISDRLRAELLQVTVIQLAPQPEEFADLFIACPTIRPGHGYAGEVMRSDGVVLSGSTPSADDSAESILESLIAAYQQTVASNK